MYEKLGKWLTLSEVKTSKKSYFMGFLNITHAHA